MFEGQNLENGIKLAIDWNKVKKIDSRVIPVVVQNIRNREVLLVGYVNYQALLKTLETKVATFYSTSRKKIWVKGETSGNKLIVREVRINCEQNSLLYLVELEKGGACHVKNNGQNRESCFYRRITDYKKLEFLEVNLIEHKMSFPYCYNEDCIEKGYSLDDMEEDGVWKHNICIRPEGTLCPKEEELKRTEKARIEKWQNEERFREVAYEKRLKKQEDEERKRDRDRILLLELQLEGMRNS